MRQLATIQKIKEILPIEGRDKIGLATFENVGWKVIVVKEEMKPGDLVVYIEYDSVLPDKPEFEFLKNRCWRESVRGYKIGAMKMGGVVSEGIAFDLSILPKSPDQYKEGDDVSKILGIELFDDLFSAGAVKYERTNHKSTWYKRLLYKIFPSLAKKIWGGKGSRAFPSYYIDKTDETRIQVFPHILEKHKGLDILVTEKLDGCSSTFLVTPSNEFIMASRNLALDQLKIDKAITKYNSETSSKQPMRDYWRIIASKYNIPEILNDYKKSHHINIAIQGEICGPSVQHNKLDLKELELYLFNLYNVDTREYLPYSEMIKFANEYNLKVVPLLEERKLDWDNVDDLVEFSKGFSVINTKSMREGLVIRAKEISKVQPEHSMGKFFSFKVINPDFLVKYSNEK